MKMAIRSDRRISFCAVPGAGAAAFLLTLATANTAAAAGIRVVTPGEQNTQSGDYECDFGTPPKACGTNAWLYYPELLQMDLGSAYAVESDGDGGAILGCDPNDAATATIAGGNSICAQNGNYDKSVATPPKIVIIGTFGEHDQRVLAGLSATEFQKLYTQSIYEAAYKGLISRYMTYTSQIYLMTPIDLKWNSPALPSANDDLVTDVMLPAARAAAAAFPQVTVLDTYEALTSTPALVTQYTMGSGDGQLNAAGQLKMTSMILEALQSDGGSPVADASADTGTASSGAATTGASSGAGTGSSGVASGTSTGGTGTTTGAETGTSTGGSGSVGTGSASGSLASSGAGSAGEPTSGTGVSGGGSSGAGSQSGSATAATSPKSSGCALTGVKGSGEGAALALLSLGIVASVRRRRS
jgi:MYXO-CTERM domain-containing protein